MNKIKIYTYEEQEKVLNKLYKPNLSLWFFAYHSHILKNICYNSTIKIDENATKMINFHLTQRYYKWNYTLKKT